MRRIAAGLVFAIVFVPALSTPALSASQQDYDDCSQTTDAARSIAACTRVIADQGQSAPDRAGAYLQRGNDYIASGKLDDAITDYGAAIQLDQNNLLAYAARAIAYWRKSDREHAVADYKQAATIDAANIDEMTLPNPELKAIRQTAREGLCGLAAADWTTTQSVATVAAYEDHLARFSICAFAAIAQARIAALNQPSNVKATGEIEYGQMGVQIRAVTPEDAAKMGLAAAPRGILVADVNAASPALQAGVKKDDVIISFDGDKVSDAQELAAMTGIMTPGAAVRLTILRAGEEKNVDVTLGARRGPPQAAVAYADRASALARKQAFDGAIADYTTAITIDPEYAAAYYLRGEAYYNKKDYDRAVADLNDAIAKDPGLGMAYFDRGNVYTFKREFDQAIADYDRVIQIFPTWPDGFRYRGNAKQLKGDEPGAAADWAKANELEGSKQ